MGPIRPKVPAPVDHDHLEDLGRHLEVRHRFPPEVAGRRLATRENRHQTFHAPRASETCGCRLVATAGQQTCHGADRSHPPC